ncbi:MAG: CPBP family intramembrane metalloprotease [Flavobacteriaceae bacterium]|jgi:membrane protease YdiL (CAAX protease family)|nr:CPBP family intramembrane metalloprotease [Flavobacteriaceae bacterium]
MKHKNLTFHICLFFLGMAGILSLLFVPFNLEVLPPEIRDLVLKEFTEFQLRILSLVNPVILLLISLLIGFFVNKNQPKFSYLYSKISKIPNRKNILFYLFIGLLFGFAAFAIMGILYLPIKDLPQMQVLENNTQIAEPPLITKIFYGGITEEIIVRWGWLSLILFICNKLFKKEKISIILAILISSLMFGLGHLPIVFQSLGDSINVFIIFYIIIFNAIGGIIFGYLFLKHNLETAMFAHIFFHVFTFLFNLIFMS